MKRLILGLMVLSGAVFLSGCVDSGLREVKDVPQKEKVTLKEESKSKESAPSNQNNKPVINNGMNDKYSEKPKMMIDTKKTYTAVMKTSAGDMTIELNAKDVPVTVNNFVFLAKEKFYDGVIFHRTIPGFMIQGGDPTGTGMGGPGYRFDDEPFTGEYKKGVLAMANSGPNTNGSQFFIMHADYPLPKSYVIFGEVTGGIEVVDMIATAPTLPGGEKSTPVNPVKIESITVSEK